MQSPEPSEVKDLRINLQIRGDINITSAQDECAKALHVPRRTWQKWEAGERRMHPAMWDLANRKLNG